MSTEVHWLIEHDVFAETAVRVCAALDARAQPWTRYHDDVEPHELPASDTPVLFWGSLEAAYVDSVARRWSPGAIGGIERFACSAYLEGLADVRFANADAHFTTVAELVADPRAAAKQVAASDRVFVRPDSPLKPFSGRALEVSAVSLAALDHGFYYDNEDLPVVVSTPKSVEREWRFVVADGQVVAGCEYQASRTGVESAVPQEAREVAASVASAPWQPAPLYIVDVGQLPDGFRAVELNPFSGADLYFCEAAPVVEAASAIAYRIAGRTR